MSTAQLLGFSVGRQAAHGRIDPHYHLKDAACQELLSRSRYPLVPVDDLVESLQYGASEPMTTEPVGPPILRMGNIEADRLSWDDLKYVDESVGGMDRYQLERGDVLVNRTNSKELVGKTAVVAEDCDAIFASYLLRLKVDRSRVLPEFLALVLASEIGRRQIDRDSRQIIGMANINAKEVGGILVPLPRPDVQARLVEAAQAKRADLDQVVEEASEGLVAALVDLVEAISPEQEGDTRRTVAVALGSVRGGRLDAQAQTALRTGGSHVDGVELCALADLLLKSPTGGRPPVGDDGLVPFVGLPECDLTRVREISRRPLEKVTSRWFSPGAILFARIEPSVFNKKYVWTAGSELPLQHSAYVSSEFLVVEPDPAIVAPAYLYAFLFTDQFQRQIRGRTTGSSGRRRLQAETLEAVQVPVVSLDRQRRLGESVVSAQAEMLWANHQADRGWELAKASFVDALIQEA